MSLAMSLISFWLKLGFVRRVSKMTVISCFCSETVASINSRKSFFYSSRSSGELKFVERFFYFFSKKGLEYN